MSYLFRSTGQVIGVSLSSAIVQSILTTDLPKRITGPGAAEIIARIREDTEIIKTLEPAQQAAAVAVYSKALRVVFGVNVGLAVLGLIGLWAIKEEVMPEGNKQGRSANDEHRSGQEGEDGEADVEEVGVSGFVL